MGTFTLDLTKFVEKAKVKPSLVVKKVILDVYSRIVQRTPVDTGRARGGWQVSGSLNSGDSNRFDQGGTGLDSGKINSLDTNKDGVIGYIFNNVKYIKVLEDGRGVRDGQMRGSEQAPKGMVKVTLLEFQMFINRAARSL